MLRVPVPLAEAGFLLCGTVGQVDARGLLRDVSVAGPLALGQNSIDKQAAGVARDRLRRDYTCTDGYLTRWSLLAGH